MENVLNEREVVRFLLDRGGRCTNFELVSNFRGVLNDPRYQGAARIKFKDIINTVAIVGEFQNTKYIELKREFYTNNNNNHVQPDASSEPSSLSSDSSYSSPLTQNFQPYWRYRLSSSKQTLPSPPSLDFDPRTPHPGEVGPPLQNRRFSTNSLTSSQDWDGNNRLQNHRSTNDLHQRMEDPRRFTRSDDVFHQPGRRTDTAQYHRGNEPIRRTESFDPRSPEISLSRNVEAMHGIQLSRSASNRSASYSGPPSYHQESRKDPEDFHQDSDNLRNVARALFRDPSTRMSPRKHDPPPPRKIDPKKEPVSPLRTPEPTWNPTIPKIMTPSNNQRNHEPMRNPRHSVSSESSDSRYSISSNIDSNNLRHSNPRQSVSSESSDPRYSISSNIDSNNLIRHSSSSLSEPKDHRQSFSSESSDSRYSISSNIDSNRHSSPKDPIRQGGPKDVTNFHRRNSNQESLSPSQNLDASKNRYRSEGSLVSLRSEEESSGFVSGNNSGSCTPESGGSRDVLPPPLPDRKREPAKGDETPKQKEEEWTVSSAGKVRDRVQHFDDMEKRKNTKRSHSPFTPDKENRMTPLNSKGLVTDDDVSISVIDSKLRKEWFVKAAQCDYHALVGLLKKEPKLAAIKDIAMGYTALHWAAKQGDANIIKLIAGSYKVNPNIRSNGGYTPVHLASLHKHGMIVHLLVHTYGADLTIRDYSGKKPHQYPDYYLRIVAGQKTAEKKPPVKIIEPPIEKEVSNSFMRIGSLNLRKSRKSTVFASVRGRNWGSNNELRRGYRASMRKKLHKSLQFQPSLEKRSENAQKNDSDSDSTFGFSSKKHNS